MRLIHNLATCAAAMSVSAFAWPAAQGQPTQYPARPVRFVVPFTPGGGADLAARQVAARLSEQLGQQFVIDNRGGGGGLIGMTITADAAPDGYTLNAALNRVVTEPTLKKSFESQGIDTTGGTPERLAKVVRDDYERWSIVVKSAGITIE